jgi:hypothetical protein
LRVTSPELDRRPSALYPDVSGDCLLSRAGEVLHNFKLNQERTPRQLPIVLGGRAMFVSEKHAHLLRSAMDRTHRTNAEPSRT